MTIGFILDSNIDFPGGVQRFVKGLYNFITQKGHKGIILTSGREGESEKDGYYVYRLGSSKILPGNGTEVSVFADWIESNTIQDVIQDESVDIIHLQGMFGLLGMRFLDCTKVASLATFHNFVEADQFPAIFRMFFPLLKHYIDKLDYRVADSETALDLVQQIAPGDYEIIPPGVNVARFKDAEPLRAFPNKMIEILYVGRLDERKGLMYLIESYQHLLTELPVQGNITPQRVSLAIVGHGPLREEAESYVKDNNISNVRFLGFVDDDDLPGYYRGADIYCSPATRGECFGIVLTEAMSAGLPVVAFDNAGYRNVLKDKGKRFLIKNRDLKALSEALKLLVVDEDLRRDMADWSRESVDQYDWSVVGGRYIEIYQELLS